jgi:ABC-type transport system involved in multi-copper enzyme maturation permease subunit
LAFWNAVILPWAQRAEQLNQAAEWYFYLTIGTQLVLVLLAAPAATVGALDTDRRRGVLIHLLASDLSGPDIIVSKLAARLPQVVGLVLAGVPILCAGLYVGLADFRAVLGGLLVVLGTAIVTATLPLTLEACGMVRLMTVAGAYVFPLAIVIAAPAWWMFERDFRLRPVPALDWINPFWVAFLPYHRRGETDFLDQLGFLAGSLAIAIFLAAVAGLCLRRVALRRSDQAAMERRRQTGIHGWLRRIAHQVPRPPLDLNPVLWRDWRRESASEWGRLVWATLMIFALFAAILGLSVAAVDPGGQFIRLYSVINGSAVVLGMLFVSVVSVTGFTEERDAGTLELVLATPLSARTIVWGKWWGAYRLILLVAALPTAISAAVAGGPTLAESHWPVTGLELRWLVVLVGLALVLAYGAFITSLGLALAVWVRRAGLAIGLSLGGLFCMIFVVPDAMTLVLRSDRIQMASPVGGILFLFDCLQGLRGSMRPETFLGWAFACTCFYTMAAAALVLYTVRNFDFRMGRTSISQALLPRH